MGRTEKKILGKNAAKIIKALNETMPSRTTEEWIALLQPKEVFCERVNNYSDYLDHPHVKESGAVDWIEQDGFARLPVANIPGLPPASEHAPQQHAPHIGEDGPDILSELGYSAAEIRYLIRHEHARTLADVAQRRTSLAITGALSSAAVTGIAAILANELGWSREQTAAAERDFRARLARDHGLTEAILAERDRNSTRSLECA